MNMPRPSNDRAGKAAACRRLARACVIAILVTAGVAGRAEDDRPVDDVPQGAQRNAQQQANWIDLGANFDNNVFQQTGGGFSLNHGRRRQGGPAPAASRPENGPAAAESPTLATIRKLADARLARIDAACRLTEPQRRKLRLAMESDIRRLAEEIDAERRKYQGVEVNFADQDGQRRWQQFQQDVQRCRERLQTLLNTDSLFMKVLPTALEPDQYARLTAETDARRAALWKGLVAAAMLKLNDLLGLDQGQFDALEKLLLDRQPPLRLEGFVSRQNQHAQQMLVFMVLSEVDGERLRAGVSDRQGKMLAQFAAQGKAMRSFIEAQGLLEKTAP